jgi:hypothetical protein
MPNNTYSIDGVPLDDPAGRWRLTSKTELPQWGSMVSPSVKVPRYDGVLALAPMAAGVSTVKLELLILAAHQTVGLRTLRRITGGRTLHTMGWTRRDGEELEALVRVSSSVAANPKGVDGDLLVSFTLEAVAGEWRRKTAERVDAVTNGRKSFPIVSGKDALVTHIAVKADTDGGTVTVRDTLGDSILSIGRVPSQQWLVINTEAWDVRSVPLGRENSAADADPNSLPVAQRSVPTLSISPGGFRLVQRENGDGVIEVNGGSAILWWRGAY